MQPPIAGTGGIRSPNIATGRVILGLTEQYLDAQHHEHTIRHHVRRLESLGLNVEIRELPQAG